MAKQEPLSTWLPLGRAVFVFGMDSADGGDKLFSYEAFAKFGATPPAWLKERSGAVKVKIGLAGVLKEKSGADEVAIDPTTASFVFTFGKTVMGSSPWVILKPPKVVVVGGGLILPTVDTDPQFDAVRRATSMVWHVMLSNFDCAVAAGAVVLYGQPGAVAAEFERIPVHVWRLLDVEDWQDGTAVARDGARYFSIYAEPSAVSAEPAAVEAPAAAIEAPPAYPTKKPGRPKWAQDWAAAHMEDDMREGRVTEVALRNMLQKHMKDAYDVAPDTYRKALKKVFDEPDICLQNATARRGLSD
jgi:hypothetical protein